MNCVSCSAANRPGARFCSGCGGPLGSAPSASPPTVQVPAPGYTPVVSPGFRTPPPPPPPQPGAGFVVAQPQFNLNWQAQSVPQAPYFVAGPAATHQVGGFHLAGLGARFGAALLDIVIVALVPLLLVMSASASSEFGGANAGLLLLGYGMWIVLPFINHVLIQGITGSSLGKKAVGLRLVKDGGVNAGAGPAFGRWLLGALLSGVTCGIFGLVDIIVMLSNERRQRLVDQWLRLHVVSTSGMSPGQYS